MIQVKNKSGPSTPSGLTTDIVKCCYLADRDSEYSILVDTLNLDVNGRPTSPHSLPTFFLRLDLGQGASTSLSAESFSSLLTRASAGVLKDDHKELLNWSIDNVPHGAVIYWTGLSRHLSHEISEAYETVLQRSVDSPLEIAFNHLSNVDQNYSQVTDQLRMNEY